MANNGIRASAVSPNIAFVDQSTTKFTPSLEKIVSSLSVQIARDFGPIWGVSPTLRISKKPKPDDWQVVFLDDADAASALGLHELDFAGQPISKVFVKPTLEAGEEVSVTASHEVLEMLIDPSAQLWAQGQDGLFYAYEVCDAVEDEKYDIDGVTVSNFVYPSFFESWHKPRAESSTGQETRFDHLNKVSRPFQTLRKGYQIVSNGANIAEVFGSPAKQTHFCQMEDRTMHRSEYRIYRVKAARGPQVLSDDPFCGCGLYGQSSNRADNPFTGWGLPRADNPFPGWGLPRRLR